MIVAQDVPRIVLVGLPQLTCDLISEALVNAREGSIVAAVPEPRGLRELIASTGANVLIFGTEEAGLSGPIAELISSLSPPEAVVIPIDGSGVVLHVVRPVAVPLGDVSGAELVNAIATSLRERMAT